MSQSMQKLGEQIAFYRKKAGLTQSALAEKISVSIQSISRWERGGVPDATVLPDLAEALHVTIDQLYGIPSGQHVDIPRLLDEEFQQIPREQLFEAAYQYAYTILKSTVSSYEKDENGFHKLLTDFHDVDRRFDNQMLPPSLVYYSTDSGVMSLSAAKDLHYFFFMQDPEYGYASIMKNKDAYLQLFEYLTKEHRLDMLLFLYGECREGFIASKAAVELQIPEELAEEILQELYNLNFLQAMQVASTNGKLTVYTPGSSFALIPFLYFGAELMVSSGTSWVGCFNRKKPYLTAPLGTDSVTKDWITKEERIGGDVKPGVYGRKPII